MQVDPVIRKYRPQYNYTHFTAVPLKNAITRENLDAHNIMTNIRVYLVSPIHHMQFIVSFRNYIFENI